MSMNVNECIYTLCRKKHFSFINHQFLQQKPLGNITKMTFIVLLHLQDSFSYTCAEET